MYAEKRRYLDVTIVRSRFVKCSLSHAKKLFYRSANAIFGEIGRIAWEEVVIQLIISKCIPVILYGLEACPQTKSDLQSMDFVINRFLWSYLKEAIWILLNTVNTAFLLTCRVICGKSEPERLNVNYSVNFVNIYRSQVSVCLSVWLFVYSFVLFLLSLPCF